MNCSQCGAQIEENLKFCPQCGARVETIENQSETEKGITRPVAISKPREKSTWQQSASDSGENRQLAPDTGYQWENRKGINGFAETLIAIITNPVSSGEALYLRLDQRMTLLYMGAIILISACTSYLMFINLAAKAAELFYNILDYFFGYGTIQYMIGEINIQVLLLALLSSLLLIIYVTLAVIGVYKIGLKVDIDWIECVQLLMMPMVIAFLGKVAILLVGFISIKGAVFLTGFLAVTIAVLSVVQFINRLGLSAMTVYTMPAIYTICSMVRWILVFQVIKGYL